MKTNLTNSEILTLNAGMGELLEQPIVGALKFKIARNMKVINDAVAIIQEAIVQGDDLEQANKEVLEQVQDLTLVPFYEEELEALQLSAICIMRLEQLIEQKEGADNGK